MTISSCFVFVLKNNYIKKNNKPKFLHVFFAKKLINKTEKMVRKHILTITRKADYSVI